MRTNDGVINKQDMDKPNPRADSFSLYLNYVAQQLMMNIHPRSKLLNKCQKTIRPISKIAAMPGGTDHHQNLYTPTNFKNSPQKSNPKAIAAVSI